MYSVQYAAITRIDGMLFYTYSSGKPAWNRTQRERVVLKGLQAVACGWKSVRRYSWVDLMRHPRLGSLKVRYTVMGCAMVEGLPMVSCSGYKESRNKLHHTKNIPGPSMLVSSYCDLLKDPSCH